jgi:hypothetical protein
MKGLIRVGIAVALASVSVAAAASGRHDDRGHNSKRTAQFERVATFVVCENTSCDRDQVELTAAEIVAASEDGKTLIYTDSPNESLGFVDIRNPGMPKALGALKLDGEPTSVAVRGPWRSSE